MNFSLLFVNPKIQILLWESDRPSIDLTDFNCNYLKKKKLLENISKEQKSVFLLADFKVTLFFS